MRKSSTCISNTEVGRIQGEQRGSLPNSYYALRELFSSAVIGPLTATRYSHKFESALNHCNRECYSKSVISWSLVRSRVSSIGSCPSGEILLLLFKGTLKVSSESIISAFRTLLGKISNCILCFELIRRGRLKFVKTFIGNFPDSLAEIRTHRDFVPVNSDRF